MGDEDAVNKIAAGIKHELHPLTTPVLFGRTLDLFRRHIGLFTGIAAPPVVFVVILGLLSAFGLSAFVSGPPSEGPLDLRALWQQTSGWIRAAIIVSLLGLVVSTVLALKASVLAAADLHQGRSAGVLQSYTGSRGKRMAFFWLLLYGLGTVGAVHWLLLIVSQAIIALFIGPAIPVALLENRTRVDALKRWAALRNERSFARLLLIQLFYFALQVVAFLIFFLARELTSAVDSLYARTFVIALGFFLPTLFALQCWAIVLTVNYFDQRARKENWSPNSAS